MSDAVPAPGPDAPTCLVTGATGALGPAVVRALREKSYRVRVLARSRPPAGLLPDHTEVVSGHLLDEAALREAARGAAVVIHLAAKLHVASPTRDLFAEYERVNVEGTRLLVHAATRAGVERFVYGSTISVYGPSAGAPLDETSPVAPDGIYASTKHRGEGLVLEAGARGGPQATVLRLAAVYGPRVKGNYRRLLEAMARGRFVPIGPGQNRRTLVHEADVARATVLAAGHPAPEPCIYNVTDGTCPTLAELLAAMGRAVGRRAPAWSLPVGPVRAAARALEGAASLVGRRMPFGAAVDKYLEDVAVDGSRLQNELGFAPAYDLETGWRHTVDELRRRDEL